MSTALKKKLLKNSRLYVVLDRNICKNNAGILNIAKQAIKAGVDIIQLRDKFSETKDLLMLSEKLRSVLKNTRTLLIINDRADIALACNADGVHLGQDDIPPKIARRIIGKDKIIGLSCHSLEQVLKAEKNPFVNYLSVGPIFATSLKPTAKPVGTELISKVKACHISKPFFAIGGINSNNLKTILSLGARRVAMCRGICKSSDVFKSTSRLKKLFNQN